MGEVKFKAGRLTSLEEGVKLHLGCLRRGVGRIWSLYDCTSMFLANELAPFLPGVLGASVRPVLLFSSSNSLRISAFIRAFVSLGVLGSKGRGLSR